MAQERLGQRNVAKPVREDDGGLPAMTEQTGHGMWSLVELGVETVERLEATRPDLPNQGYTGAITEDADNILYQRLTSATEADLRVPFGQRWSPALGEKHEKTY